jgi:hypothetical protein
MAATFYDLRCNWDPNVRESLETLVGFFPTDAAHVERFVSHYRRQLEDADALAYWGWVPGESLLIRRHCPAARLFQAAALEPYLFEEPWTAALRGKKVLVIHPFRESILSQYKKKTSSLRIIKFSRNLICASSRLFSPSPGPQLRLTRGLRHWNG